MNAHLIYVGADNSLGSMFVFIKHKSIVNSVICCRFVFPLNDFATVFLVQTHMPPKEDVR